MTGKFFNLRVKISTGGLKWVEIGSIQIPESEIKKIHRVNPVSGYVEPERPSPFEGMSEEQKEHEAVKLANIIDRLHSLGVVKPGKLGKSITSKKAFSD